MLMSKLHEFAFPAYRQIGVLERRRPVSRCAKLNNVFAPLTLGRDLGRKGSLPSLLAEENHFLRL